MTLATPAPHTHTRPDLSLSALVQELQRENQRLQRVVAELLLKNQQLRTAS